MLEVSMNNLQFAYDKEPVWVFDYQAKAGKFVCFLGQSGCGKHALRLVAGLKSQIASNCWLAASLLRTELRQTDGFQIMVYSRG